LNIAVDQLNSLKEPIDEGTLNQAKAALKMSILGYMENTESRLEEIAKNYMTFGDLTFHKYCDMVDAVTSDQINQVATSVL